MEKFLEMEETLMNENEDVIASLGLLDLENGNNRLQIDKFYFLSLASFKFFSFKNLMSCLSQLMYSICSFRLLQTWNDFGVTHALGIGYDVHKKNCLVTIFFTSPLLWHFPFEFLDFGKVRGKWCFGGLNQGPNKEEAKHSLPVFLWGKFSHCGNEKK